MIQASMSAASPDVMAATVAAPLERHLGFIADVTEMTSRSSLGSTQITLQFALNRDIDGAAEMSKRQADPTISFQLMRKKLEQSQTIVQDDPAVDSVVANTGGGQTNSGKVWVTLKPLQERDSVAVVTARLRQRLAQVSGARLYLQPMQESIRRP
jgi:multidrug efflux pump subunit AcrB